MEVGTASDEWQEWRAIGFQFSWYFLFLLGDLLCEVQDHQDDHGYFPFVCCVSRKAATSCIQPQCLASIRHHEILNQYFCCARRCVNTGSRWKMSCSFAREEGIKRTLLHEITFGFLQSVRQECIYKIVAIQRTFRYIRTIIVYTSSSLPR